MAMSSVLWGPGVSPQAEGHSGCFPVGRYKQQQCCSLIPETDTPAHRHTGTITHTHTQARPSHTGVTGKALPSTVLGLQRQEVTAAGTHRALSRLTNTCTFVVPSGISKALLSAWDPSHLDPFYLHGSPPYWLAQLGIHCTHAALTQAPHNQWCPREQCKPSTHRVPLLPPCQLVQLKVCHRTNTLPRAPAASTCGVPLHPPAQNSSLTLVSWVVVFWDLHHSHSVCGGWRCPLIPAAETTLVPIADTTG